MKKLTAVSLFSGCGGFDWGVAQNGVDILWANDIYGPAASAYKSLFPKVDFVNKDIHLVADFPQADILIGCYPCTGFSSAARRRWKNLDKRDLYANDKNFLFKEFLRAIDIVKPKLIFIENVRGMLSAEKVFFIKEQLQGLYERGFTNISPVLLNAADYGVPQNRYRIFMGGFHKDLSPESISAPIPTHGPTRAYPDSTLRKTIGDMEFWPQGEFLEQTFHGHFLTRNRKKPWDEPSFTIVADAHHVPLHPSGDPMVYVSKDKWALQGSINRRLSWRECARIQGLPDHIEIDGTLTSKYKVVGNSVPPEMARIISQQPIKKLLSLL